VTNPRDDTPAPQVRDGSESRDRSTFLQTAQQIAARLVGQAVWNGEACSWHSNTGRLLGGDVYDGTSGIALFLAELHGVRPDLEVGRTAEGAVHHAITGWTERTRGTLGLYVGDVGVAYTAARVGALVGSHRCATFASRVVDAVWQRTVPPDQSPDVLDGAAGAIPALLRLADILGSDSPVDLAVTLGDYLIRVARREPRGWSWDRRDPAVARNLTGMSHGASGIGHGLLELYVAPGDDRYAYGAEQAFLYEREFFDAAAGNWLDLRHDGLRSYLYEQPRDALIDLLSRGLDVGPYTPSCSTTWCHGAPGIALTRLRAAAILGEDAYRAEARAAAACTAEALDTLTNFSLCHGVAGNCDVLLEAAAAQRDPAFQQTAIEHGLRGLAMYEAAGVPWPCGTRHGASDPSLMVGEAGIGYYYLRLASDAVPSVLCLTAPRSLAVRAAATASRVRSSRLDDEYAGEYFAKTRQAFDQLGVGPLLTDSMQEVMPERLVAAPVRMYNALVNRLARELDATLSGLLVDASRVDRARFELAVSAADFAREHVAEVRRHLQRDRWRTLRLYTLPTTRVVHTTVDWDAWLSQHSATCSPDMPPRVEVTFVLYQQSRGVRAMRVTPLFPEVLRAMTLPISLSEVRRSATEALTSQGYEVEPSAIENCVEYAFFEGMIAATE